VPGTCVTCPSAPLAAVASRISRSVLGAGVIQTLACASRSLGALYLTHGSQRYGEWLALTAAPYYLSLLDLGMLPYVSNLLTEAHTHKHWTAYEVLHTGLASPPRPHRRLRDSGLPCPLCKPRRSVPIAHIREARPNSWLSSSLRALFSTCPSAS